MLRSSGASAASRPSTSRTTGSPSAGACPGPLPRMDGLLVPAIPAARLAISSLTRSRSACARARMPSASACVFSVSDSFRANRAAPIRGSAKPSPAAASSSRADSHDRCRVSASRAAGRTRAMSPSRPGASRRAVSIDLGDQRDRAGELGDRGFQMHSWHRSEQLPGRRQHRGHLGEPSRDRGEPAGQRGEVPGQQLVDGAARVGQAADSRCARATRPARISAGPRRSRAWPRPPGARGSAPRSPAHRSRPPSVPGPAVRRRARRRKGPPGGRRTGGHQFGRGLRMPFRLLIEVIPGQLGELLVTAAVHIASGIADRLNLTA